MKDIYTDLASELRELNPDAEGVSEETEELAGMTVKRVGIITAEAARKIGKPIGSYVTIEADGLAERSPEEFERVSERLGQELRKMMRFDLDRSCVLVVGLGNRSVTPDSLGPRVVERIYVTRHIKEYLPEAFSTEVASVCAIAPGVLGVTGVETIDVIKGIAESTSPKCVIAIDALASRRAARISSTVQLSNAGITPGSGVGNSRADISIETLGVPVIAIGVPLVVRASTIARDVVGFMMNASDTIGDNEKLSRAAEQAAEAQLDEMIVTPKEIDTIVEDMAGMIANAVNNALFGENVGNVRRIVQ